MSSDEHGLVREEVQYIARQEGGFEEGEVENPGIHTHVNEDGTTSSYFDKRKLKIAPRSTLQFKIGPHFEFVGNYHRVTEHNTGKRLDFSIMPRIDRGFDFIDDEWVGYKRNYFTLVSSFQAPGWTPKKFLSSAFKLHGENGKSCEVKYFAISIRAKSDDDETEINLVQHTAKRDKGPQFTPAIVPLIPAPLPNHQIIREASNVRNTTKMKKYDSTFYFHRDDPGVSQSYDEGSLFHSYPNDCIQKVARYERVQFASSINVKKPTQQSRHFRLHVVLGAVVPKKFSEFLDEKDAVYEVPMIQMSGIYASPPSGKDIFIPLQEMKTPPLIIRGRSPSNYTTSQRIAIRTSSYNSLGKMEPTIAAVSPKPTLASQNSMVPETPVIASPNKLRPGRPSKRKAKVLSADSPLVPAASPSFSNNLDNFDDDDPPVVKRETKRVETLEHIENLFQTQGSLALRSLNHHYHSNSPHMEYEPYKPPSLSRQNSVDPKDIELKPVGNSQDENTQSVGPLQLFAPLKSQKPRKYKNKNNTVNDEEKTERKKKRKLNGTGHRTTKLELSLDEMRGLCGEDCVEVKLESPISPLSPQDLVTNTVEGSLNGGLDSISISLLADSSSNYFHVTNSVLSEVDSVPRIFNKVIGGDDSHSYHVDENHEFLPTDPIDAINGLPSQMVNVTELYDELSFYMY